MTGMRGVYLVAAELARQDLIVSPTSRSALGADLLVTDHRCQKTWSVQVKTNASNAKYWLVGQHAHSIKSKTHVYVLVSLPKDQPPRFFVVPSGVMARKVTGRNWRRFYRDEKYENKWGIFRKPTESK
jgi:hypothetical protein